MGYPMKNKDSLLEREVNDMDKETKQMEGTHTKSKTKYLYPVSGIPSSENTMVC
jgi:hypothetical protein